MIPAYAIGTHYSGYTAIYSYLAANTEPKMRAVRFATIEVCANVASPIGQILGGRILAMAPWFGDGQIFNYIGVYAIEIPAFLFVIIWTIFFIHEKEEKKKEGKKRDRTVTSSSHQSLNNNDKYNERIPNENTCLIRNLESNEDNFSIAKDEDEKMRRPKISDIFSLEDLKSVLTTVTKKRESNERIIFWSLFFAHFLSCLPTWGFAYISLPMVERLYFWDSTTLADARVIGTVLKPFLIMIFVPMLTRVFKMSDMQLAIIGCVSLIFFTTFIASILTSTGFYLGFFLGSFGVISLMAVRSFVSKLLPKNEVSKALSVILMLESLMSVLSSSFYVSIFNASITFYPTLCYHISSMLLIISLAIYMLVDLNSNIN